MMGWVPGTWCRATRVVLDADDAAGWEIRGSHCGSLLRLAGGMCAGGCGLR